MKHFENEVAKLEQVQGCGYVPEIYGINPETKEIEMEYLPGGHLHEFLMDG